MTKDEESFFSSLEDDQSVQTAMIIESRTLREENFVLIKEEPASPNIIEEVDYCRCCFKVLSAKDKKQPATNNILNFFEDITQFPIESYHMAMNFCTKCFNSIISFDRFKRLAVLKQENFQKYLLNGSIDISQIHELTLESDPIMTFNREDDQEQMLFKIEIGETKFDCPEATLNIIKPEENTEDPPERKVEKPVLQKRPPASCPKCKKKVTYLKSHLLKCHPVSKVKSSLKCKIKKKTKPKDTSVTCSICNKIYKCNLNFQKHHLTAHIKHRKFECDMCGSKFQIRELIYSHMLHSHKTKSFMCEICAKGFSTEYLLQRHSVSHLPMKFECDSCDFRFRSKMMIERHMRR